MTDPTIAQFLTDSGSVDPGVIHNMLEKVKSQGIFDQMRKDCIAQGEAKDDYKELQLHTENTTRQFLDAVEWKPSLNKAKIRDDLRREILDHTFEEDVRSVVLNLLGRDDIRERFKPQIHKFVRDYLGVPEHEFSATPSFKAKGGRFRPLPDDLVDSDYADTPLQDETVEESVVDMELDIDDDGPSISNYIEYLDEEDSVVQAAVALVEASTNARDRSDHADDTTSLEEASETGTSESKVVDKPKSEWARRSAQT